MRCMVGNDLQLAHTPEAKRQFVKVLESSPEASPLLNAIVETAEIFRAFGGYEDSVASGKQDQHVFHRMKYWDGVTAKVLTDQLHAIATMCHCI